MKQSLEVELRSRKQNTMSHFVRRCDRCDSVGAPDSGWYTYSHSGANTSPGPGTVAGSTAGAGGHPVWHPHAERLHHLEHARSASIECGALDTLFDFTSCALSLISYLKYSYSMSRSDPSMPQVKIKLVYIQWFTSGLLVRHKNVLSWDI